MSNYRRIMYEDRCQIYALSKRGASQESIAEVLGVSQSAVSREMCRNRGQRGYRFKQAEAKAQARQAIRSKPRKLTVPTRSKIETKLRQMRWSPEQISGWLSEQGINLSHGSTACPGHRAAPPSECPALRRAFVLGADHEEQR